MVVGPASLAAHPRNQGAPVRSQNRFHFLCEAKPNVFGCASDVNICYSQNRWQEGLQMINILSQVAWCLLEKLFRWRCSESEALPAAVKCLVAFSKESPVCFFSDVQGAFDNG